jgi:type I restriction enzyme S subunit
MNREQLPDGWFAGRLADVIEPRGEKVSPSAFPQYKFIGMDHVESQTTRIIGYVAASEMKSSAARFFSGDVLYGRLRPYLNKVTQPTFDGLASAEFIVFPDTRHIRSQFLKYRLNAADFVSFASHINEGDRPRVSFDQIGDFAILLPPPNEQDRIVAKIEELYSELDNAIESLKTARQLLQVYRHAILKHAFEGKLTAQWREDKQSSLAVAAQHLTQLAAGGATISDSDRENLPKLPNGWAYVRLGQTIDEPKYGTSKKCDYETKGVGVIRIPNIVSGAIDDSDLKFAQFDDDEIQAYGLRRGDILIIRSNGSISIVGKCAVVRSRDEQYLHAGYLIRMRPNTKVVDSDYLHSVLSCHALRVQIEAKAKSTSGVNNINSGELQSLIIPLCSVEEQTALLARLSQALTRFDQLETEIDRQLKMADALRQSILKNAFSGKLVDQDPNDEPASVLLERFRSEKAENEDGKKKTRRKDAA